MSVPPRISEAEWQVMEVLWADHPLSSTIVHARVHPETGWTEPTVKTLLARLVKKRALRYTKEGRSFLYSPALRRDDLISEVSRSFVDRIFDGNPTALVSHFVRSGQLDASAIDELRVLLDEMP